MPFLSVLAELLKKGVDVRLINAKEPGPIVSVRFQLDKKKTAATY